jgi:hypothetical protein
MAVALGGALVAGALGAISLRRYRALGALEPATARAESHPVWTVEPAHDRPAAVGNTYA